MPEDIYALIPPRSVTAYMYPEKGDPISLVFNKGLSFSGNNKVSIILSNVGEMKASLAYKEIRFVTQNSLSKIKVTWFNSKK